MATRKRRRLGGRPLTKKALEVEGIPDLIRQINTLNKATGYRGATVAREFKDGLMKPALYVRDDARQNIHHVDHILEGAIFAAKGDPTKCDVLVGVNTTKAVDPKSDDKRTYAGIVEYGDETRAANPYMRPAITSTRPLVARWVKEVAEEAIEKIASKL